MSHVPKVLGALGRLISYPDENTLAAAELLYIVLRDELPEASQGASAFGAFLEGHELWEVEEAYTRMFDINPACALEVGWHLFGEEYARGMFLVRMREELRKYGLAESAELPDHLLHVLAVVSAMPEDEASRFVRACVQPAVETMKQALAEKETPYGHVIDCLAAVLTHVWGEPSDQSDEEDQPRAERPQPLAGGDLLRDYPVADVAGGCGSSCGGDVELVPLRVGPPTESGGPMGSTPCYTTTDVTVGQIDSRTQTEAEEP